jgi:hypothetical protein
LIKYDGDIIREYIFDPIPGPPGIYEKFETAKGSLVMLLLLISSSTMIISIIIYLYKKEFF